MGMRRPRGRLHLGLAGIQATIANVVLHRAEEQRRILRHQGETGTQLARIELIDRHAIDEDAPALRIEEAQQQIEQRRFASPGRLYQCQRLACRYLQIDAIDGVAVQTRRIGESHTLQLDAPLYRLRQMLRLLRRHDGVAGT